MIRCDLATMPPDLFVAALRGAKRALKAEEMPNQSAIQLYPGYWNVRSQRGPGSYVVTRSGPDSGTYSCTCPDYTHRQGPAGLDCKHILLVKRLEQESEPKATPESVIKLVEKARGDCVFSEEQCGPNAAGRTCINYPFCKADHGRRQQ
jgi:hypothetical protein